jgi:hypothetical protein
MNYQETLALATKGLPTNIDYSKYLKQTSKSNMYSKLDAQNWAYIAKTVAKNLAVK